MFEVKKEKCDECLYSENRVVSAKRMKEIIKECKSSDCHFICHKSTIENGTACCRGFYDTQSTNMIRASQRMGFIKFID